MKLYTSTSICPPCDVVKHFISYNDLPIEIVPVSSFAEMPEGSKGTPTLERTNGELIAGSHEIIKFLNIWKTNL